MSGVNGLIEVANELCDVIENSVMPLLGMQDEDVAKATESLEAVVSKLRDVTGESGEAESETENEEEPSDDTVEVEGKIIVGSSVVS